MILTSDHDGIHLMTARCFIAKTPFIITLPSSRCDLDNVERAVKHKTVIIVNVSEYSYTIFVLIFEQKCMRK